MPPPDISLELQKQKEISLCWRCRHQTEWQRKWPNVFKFQTKKKLIRRNTETFRQYLIQVTCLNQYIISVKNLLGVKVSNMIINIVPSPIWTLNHDSNYFHASNVTKNMKLPIALKLPQALTLTKWAEFSNFPSN